MIYNVKIYNYGITNFTKSVVISSDYNFIKLAHWNCGNCHSPAIVTPDSSNSNIFLISPVTPDTGVAGHWTATPDTTLSSWTVDSYSRYYSE